MTPDDRLSEVFDRGLRDGFESLSTLDRELFRIQEFIIDMEMGGLSTYFYNRLPDLDVIRATIGAMSRHGLFELAGILTEATGLFENYVDPDPPSTWGAVLQQYDPLRRLDQLERRIGALTNYGLADSSIE